MKTTKHYKGHRWTQDEIRLLMRMWADNEPIEKISEQLTVTRYAVAKMIVRLRQNGIPLHRRKSGNSIGKSGRSWTHADVEFLIRRRQEKATAEEIAVSLGRSVNAVQAMIQNLRRNDVAVPMYGQGVRRLWDATALKSLEMRLENEQ